METPLLYRQLQEQLRQWVQPKDQRHLQGFAEIVAAIVQKDGHTLAVEHLLPPNEQAYLFPNVTVLNDIVCHLATATVAGTKESWAVLSEHPPSLQTPLLSMVNALVASNRTSRITSLRPLGCSNQACEMLRL